MAAKKLPPWLVKEAMDEEPRKTTKKKPGPPAPKGKGKGKDMPKKGCKW